MPSSRRAKQRLQPPAYCWQRLKTMKKASLTLISKMSKSLTNGNDEGSSKDGHRPTPYASPHFICCQAYLRCFILFIALNGQVGNVQANNSNTRSDEYRCQKQGSELGPRSRPIHIQRCGRIDYWGIRRNTIRRVGIHFRSVSLRCVHERKKRSISIVCMSLSCQPALVRMNIELQMIFNPTNIGHRQTPYSQ